MTRPNILLSHIHLRILKIPNLACTNSFAHVIPFADSNPSFLQTPLLRLQPIFLTDTDLKHSIHFLNSTLLNNQQRPLTYSTMFLHHEPFVTSLIDLIRTKRILRILHLQHSHTYSNAMITLSKSYNHWILTLNVSHSNPKQFKPPSQV